MIDAALARLDELGYIDDAEYARRRAALLAEKGYGNFAIVSRLEALGFPEHMARDAVSTLPEELAEPRRIARLVDRNAGLAKDKLIRLLASRGFPLDMVFDIMNGVTI